MTGGDEPVVRQTFGVDAYINIMKRAHTPMKAAEDEKLAAETSAEYLAVLAEEQAHKHRRTPTPPPPEVQAHAPAPRTPEQRATEKAARKVARKAERAAARAAVRAAEELAARAAMPPPPQFGLPAGPIVAGMVAAVEAVEAARVVEAARMAPAAGHTGASQEMDAMRLD